MKFTTVSAFILAFALLSSCGNRNTAAGPETAAIGGSASATHGGDAVFSYSLQGKQVSGGPTDVTQTSNMAHIEKINQTSKMQFFLNDVYNENSSSFAHSLRFAIPPTTGSTQLSPDQVDAGHVELFVSKGADGAYTVYGNEAFTVTVTNISSTRVSGSFSGKVKTVSSPAEELTITDGKFDVPLGKAGK